jgi:phosphatidylserine decarboxylase
MHISAALGKRAARVLATELARDARPKTGLLVDANADSAVLAAALEALRSDDRLTLVPPTPATARDAGTSLRAHVTAQGSWISERVRVVDLLDEAEPADFVLVGEPLAGTAEAARAYLDVLAKHVVAGGVLSVAVLAVPGLGASAELDRQQAFAGAGADLVLRNTPPVRVHRLRFTPGRVPVAGVLGPAYRPSSVPLTRTMNIDSNGIAAAGIAAGLAVAAKVSRPSSRAWLLPALAALPLAGFFRDPVRHVPPDEAAVVAASDGKVLSVQRLRDGRFGDSEFLRIAVFLSVLDVHINRAPVAGRVAEYFVEDGGYAPAMRPDAEHNVAAYTVLETEHGRVVVAQRTGILARRIVQRAPVGSLLARGERFVYLPADAAQPAVAPGDKVAGGTTVIAHWI